MAISRAQIIPQASVQARGAKLLCEGLLAEGVDTIFGYPGGAVLHIYDELANYSDRLRHLLVRHEQGAIHMAEGYARATGRVGVALVTSGPGATNAVTGIADAYMDSIPLVVITGQVPSFLMGSDAFQEADTIGITRSITKYSYAVRSAADLPQIIQEAFYLARTGRPGPVVIDLPKDVTGQMAPLAPPPPVSIPGYRPATAGHPLQVERAVNRILTAQRPVLYVGGGIIHANGHDELFELAELIGAPVTPTLMGLGAFPSGHPLCLGMLGMHGRVATNKAVGESDLLIAIGVRFDDRVTGMVEKFAPHAEIIHVDIDSSSIGKNVKTHIPILGDARTVMRQMIDSFKKREASALAPERLTPWWEQIRAWQEEYPLRYAASELETKPQALIAELHRLTKGDAIISTDVGQHQMWVAQYYGFNGPRQLLTSGGLGTMGYGLPAAIGAAIAQPDRQVVAVVGDGGFQMTAQELAMSVEYGVNVKVVIVNNSYLGMVRQWQELFYDRNYSSVSLHKNPDFVKLAEAYGATGLRARTPAEMRQVLEQGLNTPGTVVMDIVVTEEENVFPIVPPGGASADMITA